MCVLLPSCRFVCLFVCLVFCLKWNHAALDQRRRINLFFALHHSMNHLFDYLHAMESLSEEQQQQQQQQQTSSSSSPSNALQKLFEMQQCMLLYRQELAIRDCFSRRTSQPISFMILMHQSKLIHSTLMLLGVQHASPAPLPLSSFIKVPNAAADKTEGNDYDDDDNDKKITTEPQQKQQHHPLKEDGDKLFASASLCQPFVHQSDRMQLCRQYHQFAQCDIEYSFDDWCKAKHHHHNNRHTANKTSTQRFAPRSSCGLYYPKKEIRKREQQQQQHQVQEEYVTLSASDTTVNSSCSSSSTTTTSSSSSSSNSSLSSLSPSSSCNPHVSSDGGGGALKRSMRTWPHFTLHFEKINIASVNHLFHLLRAIAICSCYFCIAGLDGMFCDALKIQSKSSNLRMSYRQGQGYIPVQCRAKWTINSMLRAQSKLPACQQVSPWQFIDNMMQVAVVLECDVAQMCLADFLSYYVLQ